METFQKRIKNTLARVATSSSDSQIQLEPFDKILREFVETLKNERPFVGATIERGAHPLMRRLVTWPRLRPDERSLMLAFWWDGKALKVLSDKEKAPFETPDALGEYLIDFLVNSEFPFTMAEYEERCKEDIGGFLRIDGPHIASTEDVSVTVDASNQQRLADGVQGQLLDIIATPERLAVAANYDPNATYRYLSSGGFDLEIKNHRLQDGKIHLSGIVIEPGEME